MPVIQWGPDLRLGFPEIDRQHERLVEIINSLNELYAREGDVGEVGRLLDEMGRYSKDHFDLEEKYMDKLRNLFPDTGTHKQKHGRYFDQVWDFADRYRHREERALLLDMIEFLVDWWVGHINEDDKKLVKSLVDNGYA